jgi:GNAT superfamily N-acetyltransferase
VHHHVTVRPRRSGDVAGLVALLAGQQALSRYPLRWPLPFAVEDFLVRDSEEQAWVAEVDGVLAGHVAVARLDEDLAAEFGRLRPGEDLAAVTVLFTGADHRGAGVGGALHDTAVAAIRGSGRLPVLDVLPVHSTAAEVYRHRGWVEVGRARPAWLPADQPDVLLMVLPAAGSAGR